MRPTALTLALSLLALVACATDKGGQDTAGTAGPEDADGDGYTADEDCDDADATTNPGATELCDGIDNNCDDAIDEGVLDTWYADADGDGYGDAGAAVEACDGPADTVPTATDCDDTDPAVFPSAPELCDGLDNDCDGEADDGVLQTFYVDADEDGYGDPGASVEACEQPDGAVADGTDCDDTTADAYPGGIEVCDEIDNDCDELVDEDDATDAPQWYADVDGDGYGDPDSTTDACEVPTGYVEQARDCDDLDPDVRPDAPEVCDDRDNDCDELVDDADPDVDVSAGGTWYADSDGDGYGDAAVATSACDQPSGTVSDATDCDDAASAVNPGATEICNLIDDDCDALVDDADSGVDLSTGTTWYTDNDSDGYGDAAGATTSCAQPSGSVTDATDCDDAAADVNPGETEVCDAANVDEDCSGTADDADAGVDTSTQTTWYADADGDGYGDAAVSSLLCDQPSATVTDATDCDDAAADVNPGEIEVCDAADVDEDCSGTADDADAGVDTSTQTTWYADADGDGYGDAAVSSLLCDQPSATVTDATDCDDAAADVNPGEIEVCDAADVDEDCSGTADDADAGVDTSTHTTWSIDADGDLHLASSPATVSQCDEPSATGSERYLESGEERSGTDCDDTDASISPSATETCDGADNDCDGTIDNDSEVLGSAAACPALDCLDLLTERPSLGDGTFWVDPDASGSAFEIFCDQTSDGGGWTLAANIDDVNDPWLLAQQDTWENSTLRNETQIATNTSDLSVTAKYRTWISLQAEDVRVVYKNDSKYFLCEGLDVNDTLDAIFSMSPSRGACSATCTTWSEDRMVQATRAPVGLNCSDANEGWMSASSPTTAENARIGGQSDWSTCCVMNAWAGAAGDRGFSGSQREKTWGDYTTGQVSDDNIMIFVR